LVTSIVGAFPPRRSYSARLPTTRSTAMTRLRQEQRRLYAPAGPAGADDFALIDDQGRVRALVIELRRPADWSAASRLWQGVQADLKWPAPAIAVNGRDGYQLWFSLAEPMPAARAQAALIALCQRYLGEISPQCRALLPEPQAASPAHWQHAAQVPARQGDAGPWSAFLAPDLAPMFADEPWLDLPPSPEGQTQLLAQLKSMSAAEVQAALDQLGDVDQASALATAASGATVAATHPGLAASGPWLEPRCFLLEVMNDASVPLALRIEAAKALMPPAGPPTAP
jgi:hypothetical protein